MTGNFTNKKYYQLSVTIIEARNLPIRNEETVAYVSVGKQRKRVLAKTKKTQNPYFDCTVVFTFKTSLDAFIRQRLRLAVHKTKCNRLIGLCDIELLTIWSQLGHQVNNKWAVLVNPQDPLLSTKGYLKCDIVLIEEGVQIIVPNDSNCDNIEQNLLAPVGIHYRRQNALFTVNVYRADDVKCRREKCCREGLVQCKKLFVKIHFAGRTFKTKVAKGLKPVWNEALTFVEPIPSLFETITIELWDKKLCLLVGSTTLCLSKLCHKMELPSFGPSFLYLYQHTSDNLAQSWLSGRLFLSLNCELVDRTNPIKHIPKLKITPYDETLFGPYETYTLFLAVSQCIFFRKKYFNESQVIVSHGTNYLPTVIQMHSKAGNKTKKDVSIYIGNNIKICKPYFLWKSQNLIPSAMSSSAWLATDYREKRRNYISNNMRLIMEQIEDFNRMYQVEERNDKVASILELVACVSRDIINSPPLPHETKLETTRNIALKSICNEIRSEVDKHLNENLFPVENIINAVEGFTSSVMELIDEDHGTFPDFEVAVTKVSNIKRKTGVFFKSQDYLYSKKKMECGKNCGKTETIFVQHPHGYDIGALDIFLWFGKQKDIADCVELLTGTKPNTDDDLQEISVSDEHIFELRVHIYQGRLNPGLDDSGLADPFVRVIAFGQCKETVVRAQSLDPIWDETLVFSSIKLFGTPQIIQQQSVGVLFEVLDYDGKDLVELIGRASYRPKVTLLYETYVPARLTRQPIQRYHELTGEIIMTMELIEKTNKDLVTTNPSKIYSIPDEIRPHLRSFCMSVIFWGIRNYKGSCCWSVPKLMGMVECKGSRLESPLLKADCSVNFEFNKQQINILLPLEEEYAPSLSIGLYKFKPFNKAIYKGGTLITNVNQFRTSKGRNIDDKSDDDFISVIIPAAESSHTVELAEIPDWWSKYYASKIKQRKTRLITIYRQELEFQPNFKLFQDFLQTFPLTRGKTNTKKNAKQDYIGSIKCNVTLSPDFIDIEASQVPCFRNESIDITIRVYIVSAYNLTPTDINGFCDPYITLNLGGINISDRKNYVPKETSPVFGKCFEIKAAFPVAHTLCVKVMDHDLCMSDNLVGETYIDIENRFYTKFRAACGLSDTYELSGHCKWRDVVEPIEILEQVCKLNNSAPPQYTEEYVNIGKYTARRGHGEDDSSLAHRVLINLEKIPAFGFKLVPEHVETRSLYHPMKPRISQGSLEMWVDIFPGHGNLPPIVDITPRPPEQQELRVIVWNTAEVLSSDVNFVTQEESNDIYVVGWLTSHRDKQKTDIHYRSLNGEGSFNWRFVFPLIFSPSDLKMIISRRAGLSEGVVKEKIPPKLELQVWDNDLIVDDFIGSLTLDLSNMPKGAQSSKKCTLEMFEPSHPRVSLFKMKRIRGWWPFRTRGREKELVAGKIDMELELLSKDQSDMSPVGLGREPPQPLPEPKRPGTSPFFFWGYNPLNVIKKIAFGNIGKKLMILAIIACLVVFVLAGWLALPGIVLKKWLNAAGCAD